MDERIIMLGDSAHGLTGWYEADQLPARSGVYQNEGLEEGRFLSFRYFDGANWYRDGGTPDQALRNFQMTGERAAVPQRWRGLTERVK